MKENIVRDKSYKRLKTLFPAHYAGLDAGKRESRHLSTGLMYFFVEPSLLNLKASKIWNIIFCCVINAAMYFCTLFISEHSKPIKELQNYLINSELPVV